MRLCTKQSSDKIHGFELFEEYDKIIDCDKKVLQKTALSATDESARMWSR